MGHSEGYVVTFSSIFSYGISGVVICLLWRDAVVRPRRNFVSEYSFRGVFPGGQPGFEPLGGLFCRSFFFRGFRDYFFQDFSLCVCLMVRVRRLFYNSNSFRRVRGFLGLQVFFRNFVPNGKRDLVQQGGLSVVFRFRGVRLFRCNVNLGDVSRVRFSEYRYLVASVSFRAVRFFGKCLGFFF